MFGKYNSFPARYGSRNASITKSLVDLFSEKLSFAFTDDEDSISWAELYAFAKAFEYVFRYNGAVKNNALPGKATYSLETWENIFKIPVNRNVSDDERRKVLAAKWLNLSNTIPYLETVCKKLFGGAFDSITTDDSIQWWSENPNPESGYDWVASVCVLLVHINEVGGITQDEFERKREKLSGILDQVIPIYSDFEITLGDTFKTDVGRLGISPLYDAGYESLYCLNFDGSNDYLTAGNWYGFGFTSPRSFSVWFKTSDAGTQVLLGKRASGAGYQITMSSSGFNFNLHGSITSMQVRYEEDLTDGVWHNAVMVWQRNTTGDASNASMWVDGESVTLTTVANNLAETITNTASLTIGSQSGTSPFDGYIDEFAIWDKALTATEAESIYNAGTPGDLSDLFPLCWLHMGQGDTYPTIEDHGSGAYDFTMTNMTSSDIVVRT